MVRTMRTILASTLLASALVVGTAPAAQAQATFPQVIRIPNGSLPEGVVTGRGPVIYAGSRLDGSIYAANLRTGEGSIVVAGQTGRIAVGLSYDQRSNYIYAAGGANGNAFVYDAGSGAQVAAFSFTTSGPTFINDVIVTRDAAYFTNSQRAEFYKVAIGPGGRLSAPGQFETIALSGDWEQVTGFNANGIEASANGDALIIVQSATGLLFKVDPMSGNAQRINLGGYSVSNGDGLLLEGNTIYVVRNRDNLISAINLAPDLLSGSLAQELTDPDFDVPTTVASFGNTLYAVNARFGTPNTPETEYTIVRVGDRPVTHGMLTQR